MALAKHAGAPGTLFSDFQYVCPGFGSPKTLQNECYPLCFFDCQHTLARCLDSVTADDDEEEEGEGEEEEKMNKNIFL